MISAMLPWIAAPRLDEPTWRSFRREAVFACRKWDHQVEDVATIARGPVVLTRAAWSELSLAATALTRETLAQEQALLRRPDLWSRLGLERSLRRALAAPRGGSQVRVMRFDFHWTTDGWQVSEVNADVPGGFNESALGRLMAPLIPGCRPVGDPAQALATALAARCPGARGVGLVHATAYSDDRQVMEFLGDACAAVGLEPVACAPDHLQWQAEGCRVGGQALGAIIRFFPGEWLPALPAGCGWERLTGHPGVTLCNPLTAVLVQSKRLPLIWDDLAVDCPTWRRLLPATTRPRDSGYGRDPAWVLKPAYGRVGEGIAMSGVTPLRQQRAAARSAWWAPRQWLAQRRFTSVPWDSPDGPAHVCLGVYTIDGVVAGAYGRYAATPLIDHRSVDVPILVEDA